MISKEDKIMQIKKSINDLTEQLNELIKQDDAVNAKNNAKFLEKVKAKCEHKIILVTDNCYVYVEEIDEADYESKEFHINGIYMSFFENCCDEDELDTKFNDWYDFEYIKVITKQKLLKELEQEKNTRIKDLDEMIKKVNSLKCD